MGGGGGWLAGSEGRAGMNRLGLGLWDVGGWSRLAGLGLGWAGLGIEIGCQ